MLSLLVVLHQVNICQLKKQTMDYSTIHSIQQLWSIECIVEFNELLNSHTGFIDTVSSNVDMDTLQCELVQV